MTELECNVDRFIPLHQLKAGVTETYGCNICTVKLIIFFCESPTH
jgi:hypothetical protein